MCTLVAVNAPCTQEKDSNRLMSFPCASRRRSKRPPRPGRRSPALERPRGGGGGGSGERFNLPFSIAPGDVTGKGESLKKSALSPVLVRASSRRAIDPGRPQEK